MHHDEVPDRLRTIRRIRAQHEATWRRIDGVTAIGTGITTDGLAGIVVSVQKDAARIRSLIPSSIEGVTVEIREAGPIVALGSQH